jgi:hypothetical protein
MKEYVLDESILDIDSWLPQEAVDEVVNAIIEAEEIENNHK